MQGAEIQITNDPTVGMSVILQDFTVSTVYPQPVSVQADSELEVQGAPIIRFLLIGNKDSKIPVNVTLIRGGKVIQEYAGHTPLEVQYADLGFLQFEKSYYRLVASSQGTRIVSHPIFVRKGIEMKRDDM